jgi:hypothetical protein
MLGGNNMPVIVFDKELKICSLLYVYGKDCYKKIDRVLFTLNEDIIIFPISDEKKDSLLLKLSTEYSNLVTVQI